MYVALPPTVASLEGMVAVRSELNWAPAETCPWNV